VLKNKIHEPTEQIAVIIILRLLGKFNLFSSKYTCKLDIGLY